MPDAPTIGPNPDSPLNEVEPDSLNELFARLGPSSTDVEIERVVIYLRQRRLRFAQEEAMGIKQTRRKASDKPSKESLKKPVFDLDSDC